MNSTKYLISATLCVGKPCRGSGMWRRRYVGKSIESLSQIPSICPPIADPRCHEPTRSLMYVASGYFGAATLADTTRWCVDVSWTQVAYRPSSYSGQRIPLYDVRIGKIQHLGPAAPFSALILRHRKNGLRTGGNIPSSFTWKGTMLYTYVLEPVSYHQKAATSWHLYP